jgi:hypothetical protein
LEDRRDLVGEDLHPELSCHPQAGRAIPLDTLLEPSAGSVPEREVHVVLEVVRDAQREHRAVRHRLALGEEDARRAHHVADEGLSAGAIEPVDMALGDVEGSSQLAERLVIKPVSAKSCTSGA